MKSAKEAERFLLGLYVHAISKLKGAIYSPFEFGLVLGLI